jgi:hypothetical protein
MQALLATTSTSSSVSEMPKRRGRKPGIPNRKQTTISPLQYKRLTVILQVRRAFLPGARLAAFTGLVIGGFVPVAIWAVVHFEVQSIPALWFLVAGGLLYSALTVFHWIVSAFGSAYKAVGFCILLEGIMTLAHNLALSFAALIILVFINAVSAACALQVRKS